MKPLLCIFVAITLSVGLAGYGQGLECWDCSQGIGQGVVPCNETNYGQRQQGCVECLLSKGTGMYDNIYTRMCNDGLEYHNTCRFNKGIYSCGCNTHDLCNDKLLEEAVFPIISCYECRRCQAAELNASHVKTGCMSCFTMTSDTGDVRQCNSQHVTKSDNCPVFYKEKPSFCACTTNLCNKGKFGESYDSKSKASRVLDIVSRRVMIGSMTAMLGLGRIF